MLGRSAYMKQHLLLFFTSTALLSIIFLCFLWGSPLNEVMDLWAYLFYLASCISHAACLMLLSLFVGMSGMLIKPSRYMLWIQVSLSTITCLLCFLDSQVYAIYRFHINGFILNMLFGPGAGEIFNFDLWLYIREAAYLLFIASLSIAVSLLTLRFWKLRQVACVRVGFGVIIGATFSAHLAHIYGSFMSVAGVVQSAKLLPYYFPTTSYSLMYRMGLHSPNGQRGLMQAHGGTILYPRRPLVSNPSKDLPNILIILIDSWSKRSLTAETMPHLYRFAQEEQWFTNHKSASNGTRSGVYGLFYSLSCYYWEEFEAAQMQPLFITQLMSLGYDIGVYPSATLENPNFAKVLFGKVPAVRKSTPGSTSLERDQRLTADYLSELSQRKRAGHPTFSFLFYDLPHSFQLPRELNKPFVPAWDYADYTRLNNETDPTAFFNLYRNTCHHTDELIGKVLNRLKSSGDLDNTIVVISGDHGQEFNENKRNYWGHNSNFSDSQIGVPLIMHIPGAKPKRVNYRTTHYDVVATLMHDYLGVTNPLEDYSMGKLLSDSSPRYWHIVGSNLNYAFIAEGDTILEKTAEGNLEVYTPQMKPVSNYRIDAHKFNAAVERLNAFFKK